MRQGRILEIAPTSELFNAPQHPYTQLLLSAMLSPDPDIPMNRHLTEQLAHLDRLAH